MSPNFRSFTLTCMLAAAIWPTRQAAAETPARQVAHRACHALQARVAAYSGDGPVFLRSYDGAAGEGIGTEPVLGGAFTYDNALAIIALRACGEVSAARRLGDALLAATESDRLGRQGRLRNAYRPGPITEYPVPPMGWWSEPDKRWVEDPYQVGTATGNVAWAALALLTLAEATGDKRYVAGAARLADWTVVATYDARQPAGFSGGIYGYDDQPDRQTWKSTEHNTDLAAVFDWLFRLQPDDTWRTNAQIARAFVAAQWDPASGHFWVGTTPDGSTPNRGNAGLDAQLWPPLLADAPAAWQTSIQHTEQAHGVRKEHVLTGFDFNDDRDGVWWEGTAQAALLYRSQGRTQDADRLFAAMNDQFSSGGMIWATDSAQITTGFALSPTSTTADLFYFRLPHLGATAWAALAATGWNPLTGVRLAEGQEESD
jgi:hypothetical protein